MNWTSKRERDGERDGTGKERLEEEREERE